MINILETLYVITAVSLIIAALAYVQSRAPGERQERYKRRKRRFLIMAVVSGLASLVLNSIVRSS